MKNLSHSDSSNSKNLTKGHKSSSRGLKSAHRTVLTWEKQIYSEYRNVHPQHGILKYWNHISPVVFTLSLPVVETKNRIRERKLLHVSGWNEIFPTLLLFKTGWKSSISTLKVLSYLKTRETFQLQVQYSP